MLRVCLAIIFLSICTLAPAMPRISDTSATLSVESPYITAGFALATTAAGYVPLHNPQSSQVHIIRVSVPEAVARHASIHRSVAEDNLIKMRPVTNDLVLQPNAGLVFEAGGYHLMLQGLTQPLTAGDTVPVTFHFRQRDNQNINFEVRKLDNGQHQHHH